MKSGIKKFLAVMVMVVVVITTVFTTSVVAFGGTASETDILRATITQLNEKIEDLQGRLNSAIQNASSWQSQYYELLSSTPQSTTENVQPKVIFSWKEQTEPIKPGETKDVEVTIKNIGNVAINSPIITFEPSAGLIIVSNQTAYEMKGISPNLTQKITVKVKALEGATTSSQFIDCNLTYRYAKYNSWNNTETVEATQKGRVMVETDVKGASGPIPTPNVIIGSFEYGGKAVSAGNEFNLSATIKNTSKLVDIENVVVTVAGGAELTINGGTNTFFFDSIKANDFEPITVPFKVGATLSTSAQPVHLSVKYEYMSNGTRATGSADLLVTVPATQPDKLVVEQPMFSWVGGVGEETSFTMDYVNKGKSMVYNVEATVSGDVTSYNPTLRIGNVEAGKNGVFSFVVMPQIAGDNVVNVDVNYEDANGNVIEKHFETTIASFEYEPFDPGIIEDPGFDPEVKKPFPWKTIIIIVVALAIVGLIVWRVIAKRAKVKKEKELWEKWEAEEEAKEDKEALEETKKLAENTDK